MDVLGNVFDLIVWNNVEGWFVHRGYETSDALRSEAATRVRIRAEVRTVDFAGKSVVCHDFVALLCRNGNISASEERKRPKCRKGGQWIGRAAIDTCEGARRASVPRFACSVCGWAHGLYAPSGAEDNLAMYSGSPDILPHFAIIGDGTTQGQDSSTSNVGLEWNPFTLTKEALGINASRQLMENWKLQPVMSPGRLLRMRCAFQWAMGNDPLQIAVTHVDGTDGQTQTRYMFGEAANGSCVQCVREMVRLGIFPAPKPPYGMDLTFKSESDALEYAELIRHELDCRFPCGWFCTGTRSQVPRCACFVGRYGQTYTWVGPENIDALTRFTTSIMLLSSLDPLPPPPNIASIVEIERTIDPEGKETLKIRGTDASAVLAFRRPAVLAARLKELSKAEGANSPLLESLAEKLSRGTAVSALQNHS